LDDAEKVGRRKNIVPAFSAVLYYVKNRIGPSKPILMRIRGQQPACEKDLGGRGTYSCNMSCVLGRIMRSRTDVEMINPQAAGMVHDARAKFASRSFPSTKHVSACQQHGVGKMASLKIFAIVLIIAGTLGLVYGGFSYTKQTDEVKLGPLQVAVNEKQTVNVPVWLGAGAVIGGVLLLLFGGRKQ